ncbi:hypothetical protein GCK32_002067 [Trichostrongylus colubriformis]|uniref:PDZ domain-containing protein n=1 Tax=Trichostrongylus colubriformis TaxID=6319 RepID=A0AAN8IVT9_TRICO
METMVDEEYADPPPTPPVNTQRTAVLSRRSLDECFGFALQTYVFKRGQYGLKERITYIDYVRNDSIAAAAGLQEGDVVLAVNDLPVLQESHADLVKLMSSQLELRLVLLYQDISRILALSVRSLQLQYILAEKYILLEQLEMKESSILHGSEGSLSTVVRRARWLSVCQEVSKSLNLCRKLLNKGSKPEFYPFPQKISTMLIPRYAAQMMFRQSKSLGAIDSIMLPFFCDTHYGRYSCIRMTSSGPPPASPPKPGSFTERYEKFISRWPVVYGMHRMVVDGSRWCFSDIKTYIRLKREMSSNGRKLESLSMPELEVLVQMPTELPRVAVTAMLLPLPFGFYVIGFAVIFFPRVILTRHFWSDTQRKKFFQLDVERSLANSSIRTSIGNPSSIDNVRVENLDELGFRGLIALSVLHSTYPWPGMKNRFTLRCKAVRQLDKLIENQLDTLTERQLHFHLFIRRIKVRENAPESELRKALKDWIKFTSRLDDVAYLCAPIFFNEKRLQS